MIEKDVPEMMYLWSDYSRVYTFTINPDGKTIVCAPENQRVIQIGESFRATIIDELYKCDFFTLKPEYSVDTPSWFDMMTAYPSQYVASWGSPNGDSMKFFLKSIYGEWVTNASINQDPDTITIFDDLHEEKITKTDTAVIVPGNPDIYLNVQEEDGVSHLYYEPFNTVTRMGCKGPFQYQKCIDLLKSTFFGDIVV